MHVRSQSRTVARAAHLRAALLALIVATLAPATANALPSYARQTGQPCASCHMGFPELTPFGRLFKLNGYTMGGGTSNLPPLAAMVQPAFTHTEKSQPAGAAPHFGPNDNLAIQQTSIFYGGAIDSDIGLGAFAQATYDSASRRIAWDNTDVRLARNTEALGSSLTYGVTINNNPSVQDVWNTTPAWSFPFTNSSLAPSPAAGTLIEGGLAQKVAGFGAYGMWDNHLYTELSLYHQLPIRAQTTFGVDATGESTLDGLAPYWRLVLNQDWDQNSLAVGTFGLTAALNPQRRSNVGTDRLTDIGLDAQYQFAGARDGVSLQASWIHESQDWNASQPLGITSNGHDTLKSFHTKVSYLYENTYGGTVGYFAMRGSNDAALYAPETISGSATGSPNSDGWVFELDYMPFNNGGPDAWPWVNMRLALQYTAYTKFNGGNDNYDGSGRSASDNNALFLLAWLTF